MIGVLSLTHLLIRHEKGPIKGSGGLRYVIACDSERAYLATATNKEAATDNADLANCPGCLERAEQLGLVSKDWSFKSDDS